MKISEIDMRDAFFDEVLRLARADRDLVFLTADMGAFSLEAFKRDLPAQFCNAGIAEQNLVSVAAGLALGGKKPFIYSIIPFVTLRCLEQIKVDLCSMNLPVVVVGVGSGLTYGADGPTHHATHDVAVMRVLPELTLFNPSDAVQTRWCAGAAYRAAGPVYVRVERGRLPEIHPEGTDFSRGVVRARAGADVTIVATGYTVHQALLAADRLAESGIDAGVVDLFRVRPAPVGELETILGESRRVVTYEENSLTGGIGSLVAEVMAEMGMARPFRRVAVPDAHCFLTMEREAMHRELGLDAASAAAALRDWIKECRS